VRGRRRAFLKNSLYACCPGQIELLSAPV
jgi:hypothetical protein